jgi:hypothetical protein
MAARDKFLLLDPKNLLPAKFIPSLLGRICENVNQPWSGYFPEDPSSFYSSSAAPFHIEAKSTSLLLGRDTSADARFLIENILSFEREKAKQPEANWFAERARVFNLPQEKEVLRNILQDPELKEKAERGLDENGRLYMITGLVTVINASCNVRDTNHSAVGFEASMTKGLEAAILAVGGIPVELPTISAQWQNRSDQSADWSAIYAGESIVAIRCRQVGRKGWLLSRLRKGEIKMQKHSDMRGAGDMMFGAGDGKFRRSSCFMLLLSNTAN